MWWGQGPEHLSPVSPRAPRLLPTRGRLLYLASRFPASPTAWALKGVGDVKCQRSHHSLQRWRNHPRQHRRWSGCPQPQLEHPLFKMYLTQLCCSFLFLSFVAGALYCVSYTVVRSGSSVDPELGDHGRPSSVSRAHMHQSLVRVVSGDKTAGGRVSLRNFIEMVPNVGKKHVRGRRCDNACSRGNEWPQRVPRTHSAGGAEGWCWRVILFVCLSFSVYGFHIRVPKINKVIFSQSSSWNDGALFTCTILKYHQFNETC